MFKRTDVTRRNLLGKDGGLGCEVEGVYKKNMVLIEMGSNTNIQKKSNKKNIERRESAVYFSVYHWLPRAILYLNICSRIL